MACPHCGSWSVKADRALAGRMVCGRCGRPLGLENHQHQGRSGRRGRWRSLLLLLLLSSALLAWLAEPPGRRPRLAPPPHSSRAPAGGRW